ncbi:hypothetical protein O3M35_007914 [Rhynocoris fuscipes]|uniref:Uncharacterized protein n=1 Tax=Rhynocoris fuscipes TaxID=488301 RepID=A0AAW1DGS6_9HEMI
MSRIYKKFLMNRTNTVANRTVQICKFCVHHISQNGLSRLNNFLHSILILLKLVFGRDWFNRSATSPGVQKRFRVLIRLFLNVFSCNFIFNSSLPRLFSHKIFNLIR